MRRGKQMKQNLGRLDRSLRFGLAGLNWLIAIIGWIALIESFLGWCWLHNLFNINNKSQ